MRWHIIERRAASASAAVNGMRAVKNFACGTSSDDAGGYGAPGDDAGAGAPPDGGADVLPPEKELESSYGVRPAAVAEDALAAAHRRLDEVVPGDGPLRDRVIAWREGHTIPADRLEGAVRSLAEDFAARTRGAFGLPDGEHVDWVL